MVAVDCISPETPADVFNVLCDDVKIASRVFTRNRQFAEQQLMQKRGGSWQYVSREISSIHLQDHSQIMIRGGSYALRPASGNVRLGKLKHFEDQREQIAQWTAEAKAKSAEIHAKQTELAELKRQLKGVWVYMVFCSSGMYGRISPGAGKQGGGAVSNYIEQCEEL